MLTINELIDYARQNNCSDLHLTAKLPPVFRRLGQLEVSALPCAEGEVEALISSMLTAPQKAQLAEGLDVDFCYVTPAGLRQRVNIYQQQNKLCAAIRILNDKIPTMDDLGLPEVLKRLALEPRGLVLVTGPTGSGKSTTLAAMINYINSLRHSHIITIEDPIEYAYEHNKCVIHQREVGLDVASFAGALRSSLREDPDVILVGEMRDYETISAAITAAETGHLVLSTLHTTGAASTIDRIIDVFPPHNQQQIRTQLSSVLKGVVTQQLLPLADGSGRIACQEIMLGSDAILNLIRDSKGHQINSIIQTSMRDGMQTLDKALAELVRTQKVAYDVALERCTNVADFNTMIR